MNNIDLYDDKGSCQLCSTSTIQRRVDQYERAQHALKHIDQGDKITISMPFTFKVELSKNGDNNETS